MASWVAARTVWSRDHEPTPPCFACSAKPCTSLYDRNPGGGDLILSYLGVAMEERGAPGRRSPVLLVLVADDRGHAATAA